MHEEYYFIDEQAVASLNKAYKENEELLLLEQHLFEL